MIARLGDHILLELGRRSAFALEVELARGPLPELGDDQARPKPLELAAIGLDVSRGPFVGLDRLGELLLDPGPENLDRDLAPVRRHRAVDLGDRRGSDRGFVELGEQAVERRPEGRFDGLLDGRERGRRQIVLELGEVRGGFLADEVGTGRQGLAELDRGGPDRKPARRHSRARAEFERAKRAIRASRRTCGGVSGSCSIRSARRAAPASGPISADATDG